MMSKSTKAVIGITLALIIVLSFGSHGIALGQKEAVPGQAVAGKAIELKELTQSELNLALTFGLKVAKIQEMELTCAALKRVARRYVDLKSDISFQKHLTPSGLSAREFEAREQSLEGQLRGLMQENEQVASRLHDLLSDLAQQKIELFLLCKKNGLPDLTAHSTPDPALESIEQSLKAIESQLAAPAAAAK